MNSREVDPIAELLSQLSGVRRATASSSSSSSSQQLQQLQMQLQLERQQAQAGHRSSEHRTQAAPRSRSGFVFGRSTLPPVVGGAGIFSSATVNNSIGSAANAGAVASGSSGGGGSGNGFVSVQYPNQSALDSDNNIQEGGGMMNRAALKSTASSGEMFLLRQNSGEDTDEALDMEEVVRSQRKGLFVQDLILSSLLQNKMNFEGREVVEEVQAQDED